MVSRTTKTHERLRVVVICLFLCVSGSDLLSFNIEDIGERLSIDDCVAIAIRHNPGHQKTHGNLEVSSANLLSSYGNFTPRVSFGVGFTQDEFSNTSFIQPDGSVAESPITIEGTSRFSGRQLQVSETLFQGGQNIFNLMKARKEKEAARQTISSSELDLIYRIHQQYYEVLANKELVILAREVLERRNEQLRLARARHDVGSVTMLDVMQAEIDKGNQENSLMTEENDLKISRMELNRLMGIPLEVEFEMIDEFDTFEPSFEEQHLVSAAMNRRPDLLLLEAQEGVAEKEVWVQRANYLPNLSFDLSFFRSQSGSGDDPFTLTPENEDTRYSLNLDWQFFSGFSRLSSSKAARVDLENTRHDIRDKKLQIEKEVKEAIMNLESVYRQSVTTEKNRHLASENLRLEQERYRLGSSSLLDLRTAQVTYIEAETEHINKIFEFNTSFAALEKATGLQLRD